jgi:hypothetical protein
MPLSLDQQASFERAERQSQVVKALQAVVPGHALLGTTRHHPYESTA